MGAHMLGYAGAHPIRKYIYVEACMPIGTYTHIPIRKHIHTYMNATTHTYLDIPACIHTYIHT